MPQRLESKAGDSPPRLLGLPLPPALSAEQPLRARSARAAVAAPGDRAATGEPQPEKGQKELELSVLPSSYLGQSTQRPPAGWHRLSTGTGSNLLLGFLADTAWNAHSLGSRHAFRAQSVPQELGAGQPGLALSP